MTILIFIILWYILECISLYLLFPKANIPAWKALVPGLNFVEWCKIIGQPTWHAALLLIPIVNIFVYAGMEVDLVRSFGKYKFWHSAVAVIYSPIIFWLIAKEKKDAYLGPNVPKEAAFTQQLTEAYQKNDKLAIGKKKFTAGGQTASIDVEDVVVQNKVVLIRKNRNLRFRPVVLDDIPIGLNQAMVLSRFEYTLCR